MIAPQTSIITRLIPFNPHRFDACMRYIAQRIYKRPLTIFEMVKHHVMTDVFHVLGHGHQTIGGELQPWPYGPVVEPAYRRLKGWEHYHEGNADRAQPAEYQITDGELSGLMPTITFDPDDLSPSEMDAMNQASQLLRPMSFDDAFRFFHSNDTFMGRAYNLAKDENRAMAWGGIIDAHDQLLATDLQHPKRRLISYA